MSSEFRGLFGIEKTRSKKFTVAGQSMKPTDHESSSFDSNFGVSINAIRTLLYMCIADQYKNMSSADMKKDINSGELLFVL